MDGGSTYLLLSVVQHDVDNETQMVESFLECYDVHTSVVVYMDYKL